MKTDSNIQNINVHTPILEVARILSDNKIEQFMIANTSGQIICSNPKAEPLVKLFTQSKEWKNHEAIFVRLDEETECIYMVGIHSSKRGQPVGGARLNFYDTFHKAIEDCLRLSYGMTIKNAVADLWFGGAKSVVLPYSEESFNLLRKEGAEEKPQIGKNRQLVLRNFSQFISKLKGIYLVGEDANLNSADMACILENCMHTVCLSPEFGGYGNPSPYTAGGIFEAIRSSCEIFYPNDPLLSSRKILIKGIGQVGYPLARKLAKAKAKIVIHEKRIENIKKILTEFPDNQIQIIDDEKEFISIEADVFSPNALSLSLDESTVLNLKVKIVCGAENGQLANENLIETLHNRGIIYIPEQWVNYMGVFSAYQERKGILKSDSNEKIKSISHETKSMLELSKQYNVPPYKYVMIVGNLKAKECHPIDGHRGILIINDLLEDFLTDVNSLLAPLSEN